MIPQDWLFSEEALTLQCRVKELFAAEATTLQVIKKLRKTVPSELVSQLIELHELRQRATAKFSMADRLFFTRQQLEQATSEIVASHKARRFLNSEITADLCCGIGGDAIALASHSHLEIVDSDSRVLQMAVNNIEAYHRSCQATLGKAEDFDVRKVDAFHLDPDRRATGKEFKATRTTAAENFSPELEQIRALAKANPNFGIKLAPATVAWSGDFEIEFIGHLRECKQQVLWSGNLIEQPGTTATVLDNSGTRSESFNCPMGKRLPDVSPSLCSEVPKYIYDPHSSLLASGLLLEFAEHRQLDLLCETSKYLAGDQLHESLLVNAFEVQDVLKPDHKIIEPYLRERRIGNLDVKKRGRHDQTAQQEQLFQRLQQLKLSGDGSTTIILSNTAIGFRAIAGRRIQKMP